MKEKKKEKEKRKKKKEKKKKEKRKKKEKKENEKRKKKEKKEKRKKEKKKKKEKRKKKEKEKRKKKEEEKEEKKKKDLVLYFLLFFFTIPILPTPQEGRVSVKYFGRGGSFLAYLLHGAESFLTDLQLVKKFPTFYGTRRFITAFTSARHLSLS
jgi:cation transport ATPase